MESEQEELNRLLSEKIDKGNTLLVKLATLNIFWHELTQIDRQYIYIEQTKITNSIWCSRKRKI